MVIRILVLLMMQIVAGATTYGNNLWNIYTSVYDPSDGSHWYQYDAWNRLMQVHPAGSLESDDFEANGKLKSTAPTPEEWTARYMYDALGRLMRKRLPHPGNSAKKLTENYYYDGVRRIQTRFTWPTQSGWLAGDGWQEYVHGPDGVDEFVAVMDNPLSASAAVYYTLGDAGGNTMALLRASASDGGASPLTAGNVTLWQAQYSPYGLPIVAETLTENLPTGQTADRVSKVARMGHQGLFFERLDGGGSAQVAPYALLINARSVVSTSPSPSMSPLM